MQAYNTIPAEDLGKGSGIVLERCETEQDLYWKMAIEVIETIAENNKKGEPTVMIVPYGPIGPYSRLVHMINTYRISLKNCVFINMDEYLTEDLQYLDKTDPLSFRGGMDRIFYGLVDEELLMPEEQRIFPEPGNEGYIWELIQKFGKLDMCWGGVGITGHIAFNEPPEPGEVCTDEEFLERPTRVLPLARETKTINAFMNCGADLDGIPDLCITVGMKEINFARKIRMCMPRDWNAAMLRKALHGPVSCKVPVSLFQNHPDAKIFAIALAAHTPVVPEIRIYNK
jgi:glucosamine-6-phosphate deaminase